MKLPRQHTNTIKSDLFLRICPANRKGMPGFLSVYKTGAYGKKDRFEQLSETLTDLCRGCFVKRLCALLGASVAAVLSLKPASATGTKVKSE